jgi:hypothetical protein
MNTYNCISKHLITSSLSLVYISNLKIFLVDRGYGFFIWEIKDNLYPLLLYFTANLSI